MSDLDKLCELMDRLNEKEFAALDQQFNDSSIDDETEAEKTKQILEVKQLKGESKARYALMPEMQAAGTIQRAANSHFCGDTLDINALVAEINGQTEQI